MGEPERTAAVIDDGTGVYLWDGVSARIRKEWVFMGLFRCEQCGRSVTIVRFTHEGRDQLFHRQKQCPGGCAAIRSSWPMP